MRTLDNTGGDMNKKISELPEDARSEFNRYLFDVLHERDWCRCHRINYVSPDMQKAKREVYSDLVRMQVIKPQE